MFTKFLKDPQNENVYDFYKPIYIQSQFFWLAPYSLAGERFSLKTYVLNQLLILLCLGCLMLQAFNDEVYIKRASSVAVVIYYQKSLTIIRMVVNVVAFLTSHYHAKVIGKILQVFHEFDEMTSQRYLRKSLGMRIQKLIIIQLPFLLVLSLTLQIVWDLYIEKQLVYSTIFQDISVTFCFIVQSQYLTILLLLQCRFKIIKEDLQRLLKLPKINPKEAINKCSILYEFLSKVAKETDEQFGMFIASVLFVEFIEFLDCAFILLYRFWLTGRAIFNKPILSELIVLPALIKSWINTTLFFTSAIFVAEKIYAEYETIVNLIRSLQLHLLQKDCGHLLSRFALHLKHTEINFTAADFFRLDATKVYYLITGVISYTIVSTQIYLNAMEKDRMLNLNSTN